MISNETYAAAVQRQQELAAQLARANAINDQLLAALREIARTVPLFYCDGTAITWNTQTMARDALEQVGVEP